jgi:hypothetical protein
MRLVIAFTLALAFIGLIGCGVLEPEGWQSTRWGMTVRDVQRVLDPFSPGSCSHKDNDDDNYDAKVCIDEYLIEKRPHKVSLHFDKNTTGLYMVKVKSGEETEEFANLVLTGLGKKYGNETNCSPKDSPNADSTWRLLTCFKWSASRNIIFFRQYIQKGKDDAIKLSHVITYSRGPVALVERL